VLWAPADPLHDATASDHESNLSTHEDHLFLVAGTLKSEILVWAIDPTTSRALRLSSFEGHTDSVNDLHFITSKTVHTNEAKTSEHAGNMLENLRIVSVSSDKHLHVWNPQNMKALKNLFAVSSNADADATRLRAISDTHASTLGHSVPVTVCDISANGLFAASGDQDGYIIIWEVRTGQAICRFRANQRGQPEDRVKRPYQELPVSPLDAVLSDSIPASISAICISANGIRVAAGNSRGQTFVWKRQRNAIARRFSSQSKSNRGVSNCMYALCSVNIEAHTYPIRGIELIPQDRDGKVTDFVLATGDSSGCLRVWKSDSEVGANMVNHLECQITSPITRLSLREEHAVRLDSMNKLRTLSKQSDKRSLQDQNLLVFAEDASVTIIDVKTWTTVSTLRPDLEGSTGVSDFSVNRLEFSLIDSQFRVGAVRSENDSKDNNHDFVHSSHEELEVAIRRARKKSIQANGPHEPPRFRAWDVPRGNALSAHCEQISGKNGAKSQNFVFKKKPLFTTPVSHPSEYNFGDNVGAKCKIVRLACDGRFVIGIFDDDSLRGYDMTQDGKRCFSFLFPYNITCMAASDYPGQTSIICGDMRGRIFVLSLGIEIMTHGDLTFNQDETLATGPRTPNVLIEQGKKFEAYRLDSASKSLRRLEFFSRSKSQNELAGILTTPTKYVVQNHLRLNLVRNNTDDDALSRARKQAECSLGAGSSQGAIGVVVRETVERNSESEVSALEVIKSLGIRIGSSSGTNSENDIFWSAMHIIGSFDLNGAHAPTFAKPQILSAIRNSIVPAAADLETVIFGYGHTSSLSDVLGSAFKSHSIRQKASKRLPPHNLMGCCHLDTVNPDTAYMMNDKTGKVMENTRQKYKKPDGDLNCSSLDPNHRNFVLLDDGEEGEDTRFIIETMRMLYRCEHLPACCLLVRGGMEEKEILLNYVIAGIPIVILEGAGGYADHVAELRVNLNDKTSSLEKTKWHIVRSKMTEKRNRFSNLISAIRLIQDPITRRIVRYPKLHVMPLGAAKGDLGALLRRLLRNSLSGDARNQVGKR
jgi:WD40 repeat protein